MQLSTAGNQNFIIESSPHMNIWLYVMIFAPGEKNDEYPNIYTEYEHRMEVWWNWEQSISRAIIEVQRGWQCIWITGKKSDQGGPELANPWNGVS